MKSNNSSSNLNVFTIAAIYMGTVVGAGFASGQEVLQYFIIFGSYGIWGVVLTTIMFAFFGYTILLLGHNLQASSHLKVIRFANGKYLGFVVDLVITIFLFGALAAMIAGAGAVFKEQFGWPPILGNIIMSLVTLLTVWRGISGVIKAISYVVPFLLAGIIFLTIYTLFEHPLSVTNWQHATELTGAAPNWIISAINYVSFNLVIAVAILAPLGKRIKEKRTLMIGALLGGLSLGFGVLMIFLSVLANIDTVGTVEIPMIQVASSVGVWFQISFSIILFAEIYSTAVGNLFGFVSRISQILKVDRKWLLIGTIGAAFATSQLGFSTMVRYLYSTVGYGGMIMLGGLLFAWIFRRKQMQKTIK